MPTDSCLTLRHILQVPLTAAEFHVSVKNRYSMLNGNKAHSLLQTASQIKLHFPEAAEEIINKANLALGGNWILPGTEGRPFAIGRPPQWFVDPVGDDEFIWGLNRMGHWLPLLQAYTLTHDNKYAQAVLHELEDWIDQCPRPVVKRDLHQGLHNFTAADPWRALEVGIRMFNSWPFVIKHLCDCELLTPQLLEKIAISCYEHGEVLAEICPLLWPLADSNHYLMENLGLLQIAVMFPELRPSKRWLKHAVQELERCADKQLTADGGHIEGCPHYHNGCVYWFCLTIIGAQSAQVSFSDAYIQKIRRSLDYSVQASRPSGEGVPWGDSDADYYAIKSALFGYLVFADLRWIKVLQGLTNRDLIMRHIVDSIWFIEHMGEFLHELSISEPLDFPLVHWQRDLKQVAMRTNWSREAISVFFACRTPVYNTHAHIDPMSFDLTMWGKPMIVDPGRFTYRDDEDRKNYKSAEWHNTLTINQQSPFEYLGSWKYGPQKESCILHVQERADLMAVSALHLNYEPAVHRRMLVIIEQSFVLVLDEVSGLSAEDEVQLYYHLNSTKVQWDAAQQRLLTTDTATNLSLFVSDNLQGGLLAGQISETLDLSFPSTRLYLNDSSGVTGNRYYASLIIPHDEGSSAAALSQLNIWKSQEDCIYCTFILSSKSYKFAWEATGLKLIS